jgi:heme/copper-type cytochrome/quinol oxidase subunit 2
LGGYLRPALAAARCAQHTLIPAAALALVGLISFLAAPALTYVWPVVLIVAGALVLFNGLRKPKVS